MPSLKTLNQTRAVHVVQPRKGSILAECIIALAFTAVAVTALLALSTSALRLAQESRALAGIGHTLSATAEETTVAACANQPATGTRLTHVGRIDWNDNELASGAAIIRNRTITADIKFAPIVKRDSTHISATATGICPWP